MERVLVVGISGSGKSRFARRLGAAVGLPVVHLDSIFWMDNWAEADPMTVQTSIRTALDQDQWVIEGYVEPLGRRRVQRADLVVYLDCSGKQALVGGLQRWVRHRRHARPELPPGNTDRLNLAFLLVLLRRQERPEIEAAIAGAAEGKVVRLQSRRQADRLLRDLPLSTHGHQ